ncbi:DDE-type integrase/transposase/recombinase [Rhodococcus sp. T7]|uniref:DDE-type integrase/transposase/recombinase n=1 Tax=Rhodococcus sp. T7 TaxID=627444 RepID=UPI003FA6ABBA
MSSGSCGKTIAGAPTCAKAGRVGPRSRTLGTSRPRTCWTVTTAATAPNRKWVADLTRIPTGEGVLWLASVRDAFSNKVVGWRAGPRADTDLVLSALDYALLSRDVRGRELIFDSDHAEVAVKPRNCEFVCAAEGFSVFLRLNDWLSGLRLCRVDAPMGRRRRWILRSPGSVRSCCRAASPRRKKYRSSTPSTIRHHRHDSRRRQRRATSTSGAPAEHHLAEGTLQTLYSLL